MPAEVACFGIRHHGPGSARRLIEALEALQPAEVLIEGPADLSDLLPMLARPEMIPPVALLAYAADAPERAVFWPMAEFSPEYQAVRWAVGAGVPVRFIDLPSTWRLAGDAAEDGAPGETDGEGEAPQMEAPRHEVLEVEAAAGSATESATDSATEGPDERANAILADPIGILAAAAGYEDGESWWNDVIEQNPAPGPVFDAVAEAMTTLRAETSPPEGLEAAREAHMRREIAAARKRAEGSVAVVCGAWHVPALTARHTAKDDRALIKGAPKRKVQATWAPWTAPRLAFASGYGAGVVAPGWCRHLWQVPRAAQTTRWVARIARALREEGHIVSTASLIETERLAVATAALRDRPQPGFEELRDAAVATLCYGRRPLWDSIATGLLVGSEVGEVPDDVPTAPLLEDLKRQQKTARLKPEALDRELSLDLRSDSGLFRSTLLHRLAALDAPWGELQDAGNSRGTFRERWVLRWEPEFAVALLENMIHGSTIETAANAKLTVGMAGATDLGALADLIFAAMTAQLGEAAAHGVRLIGARAAQTSDCVEMLSALPPLAEVLRYGKARATDTGQLGALFARIATQGALALEHAARGLDAETAEQMAELLQSADAAIRLVDREDRLLRAWWPALGRLVEDKQASRHVAGRAGRLLYEAERLSPDEAVALMKRMLSPGTAVADAAAFFAGFLEGASLRLVHDEGLRGAVDAWLTSLGEEDFVEHLPLFRRVFGSIDRTERKRLLDVVLGRGGAALAGLASAPWAEARWPKHMDRVLGIMRAGGSAGAGAGGRDER
ncbi:MAG: DUF5682 family protein [Pseudomonadota bacterium]